ncbi:MAG: TrkA family potassium uptake protein [Candidatus Omnitrophica bacterium]|nr:TrkA family potassium uptake protein [Candidatus Omnitrophota bacterium]
MEQFMVIGLGNFGFNVACALSKAGKQVIAVDANGRRVEEISDKVRKAVTADVRDKKAISELISSNKIDVAIVSLGNSFEASILVTIYLKEMNVGKIIAKASNEDQWTALHAIGASEVIFPEQEVADKLALRLVKPNFIDYIPMAEDYGIMEVAVPDEFVGKTLMELQLRNRFDVEIIAIKNVLTNNLVMIPKADYKFELDTVMVIVGRNEDIERVRSK